MYNGYCFRYEWVVRLVVIMRHTLGFIVPHTYYMKCQHFALITFSSHGKCETNVFLCAKLAVIYPAGSSNQCGCQCQVLIGVKTSNQIYVVPPQSWGDRSDTKHSKCLLLGGRRLNQLTLIPKPKGSGSARAATAQVGPANNRNDTKRCLPVEASLRPGEAVPW